MDSCLMTCKRLIWWLFSLGLKGDQSIRHESKLVCLRRWNKSLSLPTSLFSLSISYAYDKSLMAIPYS